MISNQLLCLLAYWCAFLLGGLLGQASVAGAQSYYGTGLAADSLNNMRLTSNDPMMSFRFRAEKSGEVVAVRHFNKYTRTGYAAGGGGKIFIRLQADNGLASHFPSGVTLATALNTEPLGTDQFPRLAFGPGAVAVEAGQLYHLVFSNQDPSPASNYVSTNVLYQYTRPRPVLPTRTDEELAVLRYWFGRGWYIRGGETPIFEIYYADGTSQGVGYMEIWAAEERQIGGGYQVRQTMTPRRTDTFSAVAVRIRSSENSSDLMLQVERSDGSLVGSATVPASSVESKADWERATFASPITLEAGRAYNLVLQADSGSYHVIPIRQGSRYGFTAASYFADGMAQYKLPSGPWVGWDAWGVRNRREADLQFYLQ
jgi:hypothetical protein